MMHTGKQSGMVKLATGIHGFDDITGGGLPEGRTSLLIGGPGTGKTIFALHSLVAAARRGEPCVLVTFHESPQEIAQDAAAFGWDLGELEKEKLVIMDARIRPQTFKSIELYLTGLLAGIKLVAREMGARRVVFDSLDALLLLLGDRTAERHEMFRLRDWLLESGLTALITAEAEGDDPFIAQRHGFLEFMADCVVSLTCHAGDADRFTRTLRVLKYRGSGFEESACPFVIGPAGLEVNRPRKQKVVRQMARTGPAGSLQKEIQWASGEFKARIKTLNQQLVSKQAELDLLLEVEAKRQEPAKLPRQAGDSKTAPATGRATQAMAKKPFPPRRMAKTSKRA